MIHLKDEDPKTNKETNKKSYYLTLEKKEDMYLSNIVVFIIIDDF